MSRNGSVWLVVYPGTPLVTPALLRAMLTAADADNRIALHQRSVTGDTVLAACGTPMSSDSTDWPSCSDADLLVVVAPNTPDPDTYLPMGLRGALHSAAASGAMVLGLDGAGAILRAVGFSPETGQPANVCVASGLDAAAPIHRWIATRLGTAAAARAAARLGWQPATQATAVLDTPKDPVIRHMRAIMRRHLSDPLPVSSVAQTLGLSQKQLRLRCQRLEGAAPAQVYLSERLGHADTLVRETALPVAEIARQAGFASASAFTRAFRERFGASPRTIRSAGKAQPNG